MHMCDILSTASLGMYKGRDLRLGQMSVDDKRSAERYEFLFSRFGGYGYDGGDAGEFGEFDC